MRERRWDAPWGYVIGTALASAVHTPVVAARHELRWTGERLHQRVTDPDGRTYTVFRDTGRVPSRRGRAGTGAGAGADGSAVVVAGFRFAWLGPAGSWRHRLFLRVCIVTVPLFSGLGGYRRKLWLAEVGGDRYLGIYEWAGAESAGAYVRALVPILRLLGVPGSVHAAVIPGVGVDAHLGASAPDGANLRRSA